MNIGPIPIGTLLKIAKYVWTYGSRVGHMTDPDQLVRDLGKAMVKQKQTLTQSDGPLEAAGSIETIIEIKILSKFATRLLKIDTTDKSDYEVYGEIVAQMKAQGSDAADDIERTSEWTRRLYRQA
jgi:hypothetical protein